VIVTLLTDFGETDHYVASMKGVILSRDPRIRIVDITHGIPAQDIGSAAFTLTCCYRDFPDGTVHLAVVDPGVGSPRRAIAIRTAKYFFVGPDNGVFSHALQREQPWEVREIESFSRSKKAVSSTFHGRDVFAPAAAALAVGWRFEAIGRLIEHIVMLPRIGVVRQEDKALSGHVIHIDRFGNCVTSFTPADFHGQDWRAFQFEAGGTEISETRQFYAEKAGSMPFVILGSSGFLEISSNGGSAAESLALSVGAPVTARASAATP
jgi:S-adenosyl-L-methionine hydrolase (adenosine-forming)